MSVLDNRKKRVPNYEIKQNAYSSLFYCNFKDIYFSCTRNVLMEYNCKFECATEV